MSIQPQFLMCLGLRLLFNNYLFGCTRSLLHQGLSLAVSRGYPLVVVGRLLLAASPVAEHGH